VGYEGAGKESLTDGAEHRAELSQTEAESTHLL
jgi:hypothetical protein